MAPPFMIPVFLSIVFSRFLSVSADCVTHDDTIYSGVYVSCSHSNLKHLPDLPFNTTSVDLSFNDLSIIKNGSFSNAPNIKYLDLSKNLLSHLEPEAFTNCRDLQHLDLFGNRLALTSESFPDTVFDPLVDLRWINMKQNQKGDGTFPERILRNLGNLSIISMGAYRGQVFGPGFGSLHNLRELYLGGGDCDFHEIRNSTFNEFANISLEKLKIENCYSKIIEPGSLAPLHKLTNLTLYFLNLGSKQTLKALAPLSGRHMKKVHLRRVRLPDKLDSVGKSVLEDEDIPRESLTFLGDICVENFQLSENEIIWMDLFSLAGTKFGSCIQFLDLSSNRFTSFELNFLLAFASFSKLRVIVLSVPTIKLNPNLKPRHSFGKEIKAISSLDNPNPCLERMCNITIPQHLAVVDISGLPRSLFNLYGMYNFINGEHVVHLNFSFCGINGLNLIVTGLENLNVLDVTGNIDLNFENFNIMSNFPNLEELRLSFSSFRQEALTEKGRGLLNTLPKLKRVYFAYNNLYEIPNNLFDASSKLEFVDLSGNLFNSIPFDLALLPQLQTLDMSFNTITSLKKDDRDMIDAHSSDVFHLKLKYNLLACGCDSLDFLLWLKETYVHLDNERNYSCLEGSEGIVKTEKIIKNFLIAWRKCNGISWFYIALILFTIILASILGSLLVKTNKTSLLYIFLNTLRKQLRRPVREDFEYDAYVSYADKDYRWVCLSLCPRLEEMGLELYIYDRDSVGGDSIPDQIAENTSKSWKVILYFSNNYETDQWSYMSMMAAINSVDNLSPEKIILLVPEEEHPRLPRCLLEVVPESCIFNVPADREDHAILFRSIVDLVRK